MRRDAFEAYVGTMSMTEVAEAVLEDSKRWGAVGRKVDGVDLCNRMREVARALEERGVVSEEQLMSEECHRLHEEVERYRTQCENLQGLLHRAEAGLKQLYFADADAERNHEKFEAEIGDRVQGDVVNDLNRLRMRWDHVQRNANTELQSFRRLQGRIKVLADVRRSVRQLEAEVASLEEARENEVAHVDTALQDARKRLLLHVARGSSEAEQLQCRLNDLASLEEHTQRLLDEQKRLEMRCEASENDLRDALKRLEEGDEVVKRSRTPRPDYSSLGSALVACGLPHPHHQDSEESPNVVHMSLSTEELVSLLKKRLRDECEWRLNEVQWVEKANARFGPRFEVVRALFQAPRIPTAKPMVGSHWWEVPGRYLTPLWSTRRRTWMSLIVWCHVAQRIKDGDEVVTTSNMVCEALQQKGITCDHFMAVQLLRSASAAYASKGLVRTSEAALYAAFIDAIPVRMALRVEGLLQALAGCSVETEEATFAVMGNFLLSYHGALSVMSAIRSQCRVLTQMSLSGAQAPSVAWTDDPWADVGIVSAVVQAMHVEQMQLLASLVTLLVEFVVKDQDGGLVVAGPLLTWLLQAARIGPGPSPTTKNDESSCDPPPTTKYDEWSALDWSATSESPPFARVRAATGFSGPTGSLPPTKVGAPLYRLRDEALVEMIQRRCGSRLSTECYKPPRQESPDLEETIPMVGPSIVAEDLSSAWQATTRQGAQFLAYAEMRLPGNALSRSVEMSQWLKRSSRTLGATTGPQRPWPALGGVRECSMFHVGEIFIALNRTSLADYTVKV